MIVADGSIALASAWLAYMYFSGAVAVWHIYLIMAVRAIGGGFHWPAMSASTALMVPERHLTRVAGLNQTMQGLLNIISPPLGAIALTILPMHGIMGIDVATAAIAIAPLLFIPIPRPERVNDAGRAPYLAEVKEGFRYVWRWKGLLWIIGIAMLINFAVNPAFSLLPLLVKKHFGGGALQLSWIESAFGVGVVLGGVALSIWGGFKRRIFTTLFGVVGMGLGTSLLGLLPGSGFWYALGALLFVGVMQPLANGPLMALLQANVEPGMQGRVLSLLGSMVTAMSPLSLAFAGPISDALGIQFWYVLGGLTMLVIGIAAFFIPAVVRIEERGTPGPALAAEDAPSG